MRDQTMDFYDISAKDWAKDSEFDETMAPVLKDFLSDLPKGSKLLDIGCGTGYESKRMASFGYEVTAFDFSSESIVIAKAHSPQIRFFVHDVRESLDDVLDEKFDAAVAIALIIHLDEHALALFFENIASVLKSNAKLLLVYQHGKGEDKKLSLRNYKGKDYRRPTYRYELEDILSKSQNQFKLFKELSPDGNWHNIILERM